MKNRLKKAEYDDNVFTQSSKTSRWISLKLLGMFAFLQKKLNEKPTILFLNGTI